VTVTVQKIIETEPGIVADCVRDGHHQAISVLDLPLPEPPPGGAPWIAAYRHRAGGRWEIGNALIPWSWQITGGAGTQAGAQGSITSMPVPWKSGKLRVASVAARDRQTAAVSASKPGIGFPARSRVLAMVA
jgi:hypothetical protein